MKKMHVAVIGSGAAGIAACITLDPYCQVTLFERDSRLGGHTHTVSVSEDNQEFGVDTGFIVLNNQTYPTVQGIFSELGVKLRATDMSFGFECQNSGLHYAGTGLNGIFSRRANLLSPKYYRSLWQLLRFSRLSLAAIRDGLDPKITLGEFLCHNHFSDEFQRDYLLPMGAAIWSSPPGHIKEFPALSFLSFFLNHGLIRLKGRPQWQTVVGGSASYLRAFEKQFRGRIISNAQVANIRETDCGVSLQSGHTRINFDACIIATHADTALGLLENPGMDQKSVLGAFHYQNNQTTLHTDENFLPQSRAARASWNFRRERGSSDSDPVCLTYDMTRLMGLRRNRTYLVTLNQRQAIQRDKIILQIEYSHPVFNLESLLAQRRLHELNNQGKIHFCGSYFGYGFHEDAMKSGVTAANMILSKERQPYA